MIYLAAFIASYIGVFLKAVQQLNVTHSKHIWVPPVSFGMAYCEVFVVVQIVEQGVGWIVLPIGLGGSLGAICGIELHAWLRRKF